jgi:hypothetical protein
MMNIASNVVVTCGHKPLSKEMVKSITTIEEDIKQLGTRDVTGNTLTTIRLTDWDGRIVILPLDACRSYFQLEQKARELTSATRGWTYSESISMQQETLHGKKEVTPESWKNAVHQSDFVTVNLTLVDSKVKKEHVSDPSKASSSNSVPPFFHWPRDNKGQGVRTCDINREEEYLEQAEKAMISEVLDIDYTNNDVDATFASTQYYESLAERTYGETCAAFASVKHRLASGKQPVPLSTHHQIVVDTQCIEILSRSVELFDTVHSTLQHFVSDADSSPILCKIWGAMANIQERAVTIEQRGFLDSDPDKSVDVSWYVRNTDKNNLISLPDANKDFNKTVRRCRQCRSSFPYKSHEEALQHLQRHVKPGDQDGRTSTSGPDQILPPSPNLKDWVINTAQLEREITNTCTLAFLTLACELADDLFTQVRELSHGVQNEDGRMSELYSLPPQLIEAFRQIVVFYMATERALHYTEEAYQTQHALGALGKHRRARFPESFLEVLKRFGEGARRSLLNARHELCYTVRSDPPMDIFEHLSFGPEYVCAWLTRRLLVKPVEKGMTVGDMYREYVSTIVSTLSFL